MTCKQVACIPSRLLQHSVILSARVRLHHDGYLEISKIRFLCPLQKLEAESLAMALEGRNLKGGTNFFGAVRKRKPSTHCGLSSAFFFFECNVGPRMMAEQQATKKLSAAVLQRNRQHGPICSDI